MARKKAEEPISIEPDRMYRVRFKLPHAIGRTKFSPLHRYTVKGKLLTDVPEHKLASVEVVE